MECGVGQNRKIWNIRPSLDDRIAFPLAGDCRTQRVVDIEQIASVPDDRSQLFRETTVSVVFVDFALNTMFSYFTRS